MSSFPETYNNLKLQNGAFYMAHILFYLFRRIILLKTSDTGLNYCQHDVLSFQRSSNYQAALGMSDCMFSRSMVDMVRRST